MWSSGTRLVGQPEYSLQVNRTCPGETRSRWSKGNSGQEARVHQWRDVSWLDVMYNVYICNYNNVLMFNTYCYPDTSVKSLICVSVHFLQQTIWDVIERHGAKVWTAPWGPRQSATRVPTCSRPSCWQSLICEWIINKPVYLDIPSPIRCFTSPTILVQSSLQLFF